MLISTLIICLFALNVFGLTDKHRTRIINHTLKLSNKEKGKVIYRLIFTSTALCAGTVIVPVIYGILDTIPWTSIITDLTMPDSLDLDQPNSFTLVNDTLEIWSDTKLMAKNSVYIDNTELAANALGVLSVALDIGLIPYNAYNVLFEDKTEDFMSFTKDNYYATYAVTKVATRACSDSVEALAIILHYSLN